MLNDTPANQLEGLVLKEKWLVKEKLLVGEKGGNGGSGGHFSVSYVVENIENKKIAFLKSFDFTATLRMASQQNTDIMKLLGSFTADYKFEEKLNDICISKKLRKIVRVLDKGQHTVDSNNPMSLVPYLIMELADQGDIRKYVENTQSITIAMKLNYIKDIALGIHQLHGVNIAHQDLKPSNVMIFKDVGAKIGDLGRASVQGQMHWYDDFPITGDRNYAPPEQLYGYIAPEWIDRRQRCDLYQLGSIISFLFLGITINNLLRHEISKEIAPHFWGGDGISYEIALPYLDQAFNKAISRFDYIKPSWLGESLKKIVTQSSNPRYEKRGYHKTLIMKKPMLGIDRFVSELDGLIRKIYIYGVDEKVKITT